jgi:hypothetical protein
MKKNEKNKEKIKKMMGDDKYLLSEIEKFAESFGSARRKDVLESNGSTLSLTLCYYDFSVEIEQSQDHSSSDPAKITITFFEKGEGEKYPNHPMEVFVNIGFGYGWEKKDV